MAESTVRLYIRELRKEYNIPKESTARSLEAVPEIPLCKQMQIDFGQTGQLKTDSKKLNLVL